MPRRLLLHRHQLGAMLVEPGELLGDLLRRAYRHQESGAALDDQVGAAGIGRDDHRQALAHRLLHDQRATLDDRGQAEHVAAAHERQHLGMRATLLVGEAGVLAAIELHALHQRAEHHQLDVLAGQQLHGGEQVGQALALAHGAGEQHAHRTRRIERGLRPALGPAGRRAERRHHDRLVRGRCRQRIAHEGTGHHHQVGQFELLRLARQLGARVDQAAAERGGPVGQALGLLLLQPVAKLPVGDRQVVDALEAQCAGGAEGVERAILVGIDGAERLAPLHRGQRTRHETVEILDHGIERGEALLVAQGRAPAGAAADHARELAPAMLQDLLARHVEAPPQPVAPHAGGHQAQHGAVLVGGDGGGEARQEPRTGERVQHGANVLITCGVAQ